MKRVLTSLIVTISALIALSGALYAHHGRGSTYDAKKVVDLKGTINKVMWRNPHIQFLVDVKGPDGKVTTWTIEHSNVSTLARLGYDRTTLKPGMEVTAHVYPGSKGEPIGLCKGVTLANGVEVFTRGANDGERYNPLNDLD
jgi:uncharacterized protein DUF6152